MGTVYSEYKVILRLNSVLDSRVTMYRGTQCLRWVPIARGIATWCGECPYRDGEPRAWLAIFPRVY